MFVPQLLEYKPQQNLEFPKYLIVPPPPPPIRDTFGEPPLLTFQDYTTAQDPCGKCKSVSIKYSQTPTSSDNAIVLEQSEELSDNKSEYIPNSDANDLEINNDNHHA